MMDVFEERCVMYIAIELNSDKIMTNNTSPACNAMLQERA